MSIVLGAIHLPEINVFSFFVVFLLLLFISRATFENLHWDTFVKCRIFSGLRDIENLYALLNQVQNMDNEQVPCPLS